MERIRLTTRLALFTGFMGLTATLAGTLLPVSYTHLTLPTTPYV